MSDPDGPTSSDVLLRGDVNGGFYLVDPTTEHVLVKGLPSIAAAIEAARMHGAAEIWQQHVDFRGRPLGDPFRLFRQFR
jgi:hypothetical protein